MTCFTHNSLRFCFLTAVVFLLPETLVHAGGSPSLHADFDRMLRTHVRQERVDYLAWKAVDAEPLERYLALLDSIDPASLGSRAQRLAFEINLYNGSMIEAILEYLHTGYTTSSNGFSVFDEPRVRRNGKKITLNDLEHKIIRPTFHEPRIHAALCCGAVSCPPLLPRAFHADDLVPTLEDNMNRFLHDEKRNRLLEGKTQLSELFRWYAEDFGEAGVIAWVSKYRPEFSTGTPEWLPYDWSLNITASSRKPDTAE